MFYGLEMRLKRIFTSYFRKRRHANFAQEFAGCRTILDVGGTPEMWHTIPGLKASITILNSDPRELRNRTSHCVVGDGTNLPFPDKAFDLVFSNSVIEHLGTLERQRAFAREMLRTGRRVYCQTPNRWFPIEVHYLGAFFHWLPKRF